MKKLESAFISLLEYKSLTDSDKMRISKNKSEIVRIYLEENDFDGDEELQITNAMYDITCNLDLLECSHMHDLSKPLQLIKIHTIMYLDKFAEYVEIGKTCADSVDFYGSLDETRIYTADNEEFVNDFGMANLFNLIENSSNDMGFAQYQYLFDDVEKRKYFNFYKADNFIMGQISQVCFNKLDELLHDIDFDCDCLEEQDYKRIQNASDSAKLLSDIVKEFNEYYMID